MVPGAVLTNLLFLCARNRLRSPTAEQLFASRPGVETASAGLAPDAEEECSVELVEWADLIFVMEKTHRSKLQRRFGKHLKRARVISLDIPDDYAFMQPELVALLERKVGLHLCPLPMGEGLSARRRSRRPCAKG